MGKVKRVEWREANRERWKQFQRPLEGEREVDSDRGDNIGSVAGRRSTAKASGPSRKV